MPGVRAYLGAVVLAAVLMAASSASSQRAKAPAPLRHVFVIMLENHSQGAVVGNPNAPYITHLAHTYARAAGYLGVTHPSQPNYVSLFSGSNWWLNSDSPSNRYNHTNLVDQLQAHRLTWTAYMESMPKAGFLGSYWPSASKSLYVNRHNPFILFRDVRRSSSRRSHIKPYTRFARDMGRRSVPNLVWISPNLCHDMHGLHGPPCPYGYRNPADDSLKRKADAFVRHAVRTIMLSPAWKQPSVILILSDESTESGADNAAGGHVSAAACCDSPVLPPGYPWPKWTGGPLGGGSAVAVIVANRGKRHFVNSVKYNHFSVLATIEHAWGLGYLGYAADRRQVPRLDVFLRR
jgi:phosphatidylinositol-3-phosphatase